MKVLFFGTPQFAARVLEYLIDNGVNVAAVVSKPDKAIGRSKTLVPTPVKEVALSRKIPLYQPEKVSAPEASALLAPYEADIFVVVAYGEILKQSLLDMPKKACINLHASLLPKYRGAAPIQRAIIEGEKETGVTVMHMVKAMDAGDIIKSQATAIGPNETYGELQERLCSIGAPLLLEAIREIGCGDAKRVPQNPDLATLAPKLELEDCEIDWTKSAHEIHNLVRGVNPAPGAWCFIRIKGERKRLKIVATELAVGVVVSPKEPLYQKKKGIVLGTGDGALWIRELQLEGKKRMSSEELIRGIPIEEIAFE